MQLSEVYRQERAFHVLIRALSTANTRVTVFRIHAVEDRLHEHFRNIAGMLVNHLPQELLPDAEQVFRRLKRFHYHLLGERSELGLVWHWDARDGALERAFDSLVELEDLSIAIDWRAEDPYGDDDDEEEDDNDASRDVTFKIFYVRLRHLIRPATIFPALKRVVLRSLYTDPGELCEFLARHAATLEDVNLDTIMLDDPSNDFGPPCMCNLMRPREALPPLAPREKPHLWLEVAQHFRELPHLKSLAVSELSEGYQYTMLSEDELREVTEVASSGPKAEADRCTLTSDPLLEVAVQHLSLQVP